MRLSDSKKFVSCPGDPIRTIYAPKVSEKGSIDLIEVGAENLQDKIDSYRDAADIQSVIARFQNTGDPTVLNQRLGQYGDFTEMPHTLAEALQLQIDSNRLYDSLPTDIKASFDNDKNKFFAAAGTVEWAEKMDKVLPESMRIKKPDASTQPVDYVKEVKE